MPKQKTNKSVRKRVRITGTGKLKRNKANKRHLLSGRTSKRKRQLRKGVILPNSITGKYLRALGAG
jgi:large subunit ribosomal protein L35